MPHYTALITDLDGTLVPLGGGAEHLDLSTKLAIKEAQKRGIKIACATGRQWSIAKDLIQHLGLICPCIIDGGTRIIDPFSGDTLWEKYLEGSIESFIFEAFKKEAGEGFLMSSENESLQDLRQVKKTPLKSRFLYLIQVPEKKARHLTTLLNKSPEIAAHLTPSWHKTNYLDVHVTHREATKLNALHAWQQMEKVAINETVAMGDSGNDLPLFEGAGLKIAVENGSAEIKSKADYIAPKQNEKALFHVLEKFFINIPKQELGNERK